MSQVEVSPSRPIQIRRSTSSLQLRGKYVSTACTRCKNLKVKCSVERGTSCRRCMDSGADCIFPGKKMRTIRSRPAHSNRSRSRSRSRSTDSASSRNDVRMTLTRLDESDEEETVTTQTNAREFFFTDYAPVPATEPLGPQVCIACGSCEMVDDGWMIPQHFGVKTYVPIALSPLCPVCNSNTHEFRGRLPRPSGPLTLDHWVQAASTHSSCDANPHLTVSPIVENDPKPPPYSLPASIRSASPPARVSDHPAGSSQAETLYKKVPNWKPALRSTITLIAWSIQMVHLLAMLWIPRYYENQIRHGAPKFEDAGELDASLPAFRTAYDMTLERTEGGHNTVDTEDGDTAAKARVLWMNFVESRIFEWNILISITLVLIAASPTIFQIPSASEDRLIRTLTFLSISRAVSGLVFGIILSLHFRSPLTKSVAYVQGWFRESRQMNLSLFKFWIVVSLPASSTIWSLILFVSAIFGLVWRTDVLRDEGNNTGLARRTLSGGGVSEHSFFISALRASITILFLVDIAYAVWALIYLQRRTRACLEQQVDI